MADLEIKIKTPADTAGLAATTKAVEKLTAATKESAKSAAESAAVFQEAAKSRTNNADMQQYLSGLTKEAKQLGELERVAENASSSKSRLLDGVKKLGTQIPVLGAALGALKNPYTAIAAAAGLALSAVRKLGEDIDRFATAASKFEDLATAGRTVGSIFREATGRSAEFESALQQLQRRADTASEHLAQLRRNIGRTFGIEEEQVDKKEDTPEAAEARRQRRILAEVGAVANAEITARNQLREAQAALPKAASARAEAEARLNQFQKLDTANEEAIGEVGGRRKLVERIAQLEPFAEEGNLSARIQLDLARTQLADYDQTRNAVRPRLEGLQARVNLATAEEQRLQGVVTSNTETLRGFGAEKGNLEADLSARQAAFGATPLGPRVATSRESQAWEDRRAEIAEQWERMFSVQERVIKRIENMERRSSSQSQATQ